MRRVRGKNDKEPYRVAICVATYNAAAFIATTLDCILVQTFNDFHVVISDDASSDNTVEICQRYARADPRISVHPHSRRLGWVGNVNRALELAKGEYLMIAPHDDAIEPDYISALVAALESNPEAAVAFSDMMELTIEGEQRLHTFDICDGLSSATERAVRILTIRGSWWTCYRGVFRSSVYKEIGGLRVHRGGEFSADLPWVLRLAMAGGLVRVPRVLYHKHRKPSSLAKSWKYGTKNRLAVLCACGRAVSESRLSVKQRLPVYRALCRKMAMLLVHDARKRFGSCRNRAKSLLGKT